MTMLAALRDDEDDVDALDVEEVDAELAGEVVPVEDLPPLAGLPALRAGATLTEQIVHVAGELELLKEQAERLAQGGAGPDGPVGAELVQSGVDGAVRVRQQAARARSLATRQSRAIAAKSKQLERLMRQQMDSANAALRPLKEMTARMDAAVVSVSLYLGRGETITTLRSGTPAPADTPVTVRQLVLAMDMETAAFAEEGGIDSVDVDVFDRWLLEDPAHLDQILPEPKGIVCMRPRLDQGKEYGREQVWQSTLAANQNQLAHLVIRNGENLVRVEVAIQPGETLVPAADEFTAMFTTTRYDFDTRQHRTITLEPGSRDWERAHEQAEARERHYLDLALALEGLVHRTVVLHPLPEGGLSFLTAADHQRGKVQFILDADPSLTTGREPFEEWRARLAAGLRPGMRIVGNFRSDRAEVDERLHPATSGRPATGEVFTIERATGNRLTFLYQDTNRHRRATRRSSCWVTPADKFVIPFDLVTVKELREYLHARTERHAYLDLWPLLTAALQAKRAEAAAEEPFRKLLSGILARENGVTVAEAAEVLDELVWAYKLHKKQHAPLVGSEEDHPAAIAYIVAAHRRHLALAGKHEQLAALTADMRRRHPSALLIARKNDGRIVVLEPAAEDQTTWVNETLYTGTGARQVAVNEWVTIGARPGRWRTLWSDEEALGAWTTHPPMSTTFSPPEIHQVLAEMVEWAEGPGTRPRWLPAEEAPMRLAAVTVNGSLLRAHYLRSAATVDPAAPIHGHDTDVDLRVRVRRLERRHSAVLLAPTQDGGGGHDRFTDPPPHRLDGEPTVPVAPWESGQLVHLVDDVDWVARAEHDRYRAGQQARRRAQGPALHTGQVVRQRLTLNLERGLFLRFVEDGYDLDLWPAHRKSLRIRTPDGHAEALRQALYVLTDAGRSWSSMTVAEAITAASDLQDDDSFRWEPPTSAEVADCPLRELDDEERAEIALVEHRNAEGWDGVSTPENPADPDPDDEDLEVETETITFTVEVPTGFRDPSAKDR